MTEVFSGKKKIILIVCRGNIARSPFAEAVINRELIKRRLNDKIMVVSRGTQGTIVDPTPVKFANITFYKNIYSKSKSILDKFQVDLTKHVSKPVNKIDVEQANIIFAVDDGNKKSLIQLFPNFKNKIHKLSVLVDSNNNFTDPELVNEANEYSTIFSQIHETIIVGFPRLLELVKESKKI